MDYIVWKWSENHSEKLWYNITHDTWYSNKSYATKMQWEEACELVDEEAFDVAPGTVTIECCY